MAIHVDLSELQSAAVEKLVRAHALKPLRQDVLFKVDKKVFASCLEGRPKNATKVSPAELQELNAFLGKSRRVADYAVWKQIKCSKCEKVLTFYDIFQSGRKVHGDDYVKRYLGGDDGYHIHIQKRGGKMEVTCTACSAVNVMLTGYDGPEY
jgi:hypothetical protein